MHHAQVGRTPHGLGREDLDHIGAGLPDHEYFERAPASSALNSNMGSPIAMMSGCIRPSFSYVAEDTHKQITS
jgi:hypothetical protein